MAKNFVLQDIMEVATTTSDKDGSKERIPLSYQELLAAYNNLIEENSNLRKEIARLQGVLNKKQSPLPPQSIKPNLSLEEKVESFRSLFKGREDVFARRWCSRISGK